MASDGQPVVQQTRKRVLEMWEPSEYKEMIQEGLSMEIEKDIEEADITLLGDTNILRERFNNTIGTWPNQPDEKARKALLVVALSLGDESMWNKVSDLLITNLFALLYGELFRAHPDGVVVYKNGACRRADEIPGPMLRATENTLGLSWNFFLHLMKGNVKQEWDAVLAKLAVFHSSSEARSPLLLCGFQADRRCRLSDLGT